MFWRKFDPWSMFIGEFVEIVTTQQIQVTQDDGESTFHRQRPLVITGEIYEVTKDELFLGKEGMLTDVISRNQIVHVGIVQSKDEWDEALDEVPTPNRTEDFN